MTKNDIFSSYLCFFLTILTQVKSDDVLLIFTVNGVESTLREVVNIPVTFSLVCNLRKRVHDITRGNHSRYRKTS